LPLELQTSSTTFDNSSAAVANKPSYRVYARQEPSELYGTMHYDIPFPHAVFENRPWQEMWATGGRNSNFPTAFVGPMRNAFGKVRLVWIFVVFELFPNKNHKVVNIVTNTGDASPDVIQQSIKYSGQFIQILASLHDSVEVVAGSLSADQTVVRIRVSINGTPYDIDAKLNDCDMHYSGCSALVSGGSAVMLISPTYKPMATTRHTE